MDQVYKISVFPYSTGNDLSPKVFRESMHVLVTQTYLFFLFSIFVLFFAMHLCKNLLTIQNQKQFSGLLLIELFLGIPTFLKIIYSSQ